MKKRTAGVVWLSLPGALIGLLFGLYWARQYVEGRYTREELASYSLARAIGLYIHYEGKYPDSEASIAAFFGSADGSPWSDSLSKYAGLNPQCSLRELVALEEVLQALPTGLPPSTDDVRDLVPLAARPIRLRYTSDTVKRERAEAWLALWFVHSYHDWSGCLLSADVAP